MKVSVLDWETDQELRRDAGQCPVVSVRSVGFRSTKVPVHSLFRTEERARVCV